MWCSYTAGSRGRRTLRPRGIERAADQVVDRPSAEKERRTHELTKGSECSCTMERKLPTLQFEEVTMRRAIVFCVVSACVALLYWGSYVGVSYYRRWQASRLLVIVRQFHPGLTAEAEALSGLKPFASYRVGPVDTGDVGEVSYEFVNSVRWLPAKLRFPWTLFIVTVEFRSGLIARISISEMQAEHEGYPHPDSATVYIYSGRLYSLPAGFNGFSEYTQSTGQVDSRGRWTDFKCCHARFVRLDERATPNQLSESLNFRLSCMTSFIHCKDDRQILP
jgi:hypothetical protein